MNAVPEPPHTATAPLPTALALLSRGNGSWSWIVAACPFCSGIHTQVGGVLQEDPRLKLGYTSAPCNPARAYMLAEAQDQDALRMIAEIGAKAPELDLQPRAIVRRGEGTQGRELWLSYDPEACCANCRFCWAGEHLRDDGSGRFRICRHNPKPKPNAKTMPPVKDDHVCLNYDRSQPGDEIEF